MGAHVSSDRGSPAGVDLQSSIADVGGRLSVRLERAGRWTIVDVDGEMDLQARPLVRSLVGDHAKQVVFALQGVTFLDASGLGMMVDTQREAVGAGGCVRLVAPSHAVRRLLILTGSDRLFPVFDSVAEALSSPFVPGPRAI